MALYVVVMGIGLFMLLAGIFFVQPVAQAANAIIALSCRSDHGHFGKRSVPCYCKCHGMPRPLDNAVASAPAAEPLV